MPRRKLLIKLTDNVEYSLPLRREVRAVLHFIGARMESIRTAMDMGFNNASVSRMFRALDGCWVTVEESAAQCEHLADALGAENVFMAGIGGSLPFAEKQFDVVVLAHGVLADNKQAAQTAKECHRILKNGGIFVFTVEYRKRFGMAKLFNKRALLSADKVAYTEYEMFQLLKHGFDVLGVRFSCRFWVQVVRQWTARRTRSGARGANNFWLRILYGIALVLDLPFFWTRGHLMTVCARRKGWRGKLDHVLWESAPVSGAILCNPDLDSKKFHSKQFK